MRAVVSTDYPHQTAPHGERERRLQQARQIFMERRLVDNGASVLAAQVRRARRQCDNFVPRREANSICEDVAALVVQRYFLDRRRCAIEALGPTRRGLDKFERHVLVVADIPTVNSRPPAGRSPQRPICSLGPRDPDTPRLLTDLDLRLIGEPPPLIWKD